jgi:6-phosphogluconolactonase
MLALFSVRARLGFRPLVLFARVAFAVGLAATLSSTACSKSDAPGIDVAEDVAQHIYVGCANPTGTIQSFNLDAASATLTSAGVTEAGSTVSLAAAHPNRKFLYVNHRLEDRVSAFAIDGGSGALTKLNTVDVVGIPGSMRAGPVNVTVDRTGKFLFVPLFQGSNVLVFALAGDGSIGALTAMHSAGTNAHIVRLDPSNRFALVPYLGSDLIAQYRFDDRDGTLVPNDPPFVKLADKAGPRHIDFHPNGKWVYLVTETSGTVVAFAFDKDKGTLAAIDGGSLPVVPAGFAGMPAGGHIQVAPSGRFVYASSRGNNSVGIFSVDEASGRLTSIGFEDTRGMTPRNFTLDATGRVLIVANQASANIAIFTVDRASGRLTFVRTQAVCDTPFFVRAVPAA